MVDNLVDQRGHRECTGGPDLCFDAFLQNLFESNKGVVASYRIFLVVPQMVVCGEKNANNVSVWGCRHFAAKFRAGPPVAGQQNKVDQKYQTRRTQALQLNFMLKFPLNLKIHSKSFQSAYYI